MPESSLWEAQIASGARCTDDQKNIADFGEPAAEYAAAIQSAALFDLTTRTEIEMTGADRAKFLHNFCTNDIKSLQPGQGCEAFVTNVKGRVLGHILVFAGSESLTLESVPGAQEPLLLHLDRYVINEDVQLHDRTEERGELYVCGPQAGAIVSRYASTAAILPECGHVYVSGTNNTCELSVRRVDFTRLPGYLISARRALLGELWKDLKDAGARPAGMAALEPLRIEAGFPWYGRDITDDNLAQEVSRTAKAISFTKGCYLGQEPIARLDALGHANRELRVLRILSHEVPPVESTILSAEGKEIGAITSSAFSYGTTNGVALGYVRVPFTKPGTEVYVAMSDASRIAAEVFWDIV